MTDSQFQTHARWLVRSSPWILCGAVLLGLVTVLYGVAPVSYLLASLGLGATWFVLIALVWRTRNDTLRLFALLFVIFGQQILSHYSGGHHLFATLQGSSIIISVAAALIFFLRRWLCKFAKLEEHVP